MNMEEDPFKTILSKIYLLYYKSKINLSEAHLFRTPKGYMQKFQIEIPFKSDLDILDYSVGHRSPVYGSLSRLRSANLSIPFLANTVFANWPVRFAWS